MADGNDMAAPTATYLYTETRLNLDESHVGSTIQLSLDPLDPKRTIVDTTTASDEAAFARENLANDASVFFRPQHRSLRSFLWRLLDDRKVLELQCVDLTQELGEDKESIITLRLAFEHAVRPYCLAIADHQDKDAIVVFAITTNSEFYTITLAPDCFIHLKATETLPTDWCKIATPASLRMRKPFRLTAIDQTQLFVSLDDGSLLKLEQAQPALPWTEVYYSSNGWNVLPRALARLKGDNFVRYLDLEMDAFTIISVALSPDEQHIITICLNHTLRIWNAKTGKVVLQTDLLSHDDNKLQQQHPQHKYFISPTQRQLLQVLDVAGREGDQYYIATFSPKQQSFTFWAVLDAELGADGVRPVSTPIDLIPPLDTLLQSAAWTMEEFQIHANRGWSKTSLWLRARSGPLSRVFSIDFALFDHDRQFQANWQSNWIAVAPGQQSTEYLSSISPAETHSTELGLTSPAISDQWLTYLFFPNRYTTATLQTALHVYAKGSASQSSKSISQTGTEPLQTLIASAIHRKAAFHQIGATQDQRERKVSEEWQLFYGLVQDLHKRRNLIVSFAFDVVDRLPWIVAADGVSPVRAYGDVEIACHHRSFANGDLSDEQVSRHINVSYEVLDLLHIAGLFGQLFSASFLSNFKRVLLPELLTDASSSAADRLLGLHNQSGISGQVDDEEWSKLFDAMDEVGGYDILDFDNFQGILDQFEEKGKGKRVSERLVRYGTKAIVRTTQETLDLRTSILLNLLLLVIFVDTELDPSDLETGMQNKWRGQDLYILLLDKLRESAVLDFLLRSTRVDKVAQPRRQSTENTAHWPLTQAKSFTPFSVTLLESLFIGDWTSLTAPPELELPQLTTYLAAQWTASLRINSEFEELTSHILADLIKHGDEQLAAEFVPYVAITGWSVYLKARLCMLQDNHDQAASLFNKAAYAMSQVPPARLAMLNSARLLRPDECDQLTHGLVGYFEHVMNLFDAIKSFDHVIEFAQYALQQQSIETAPQQAKKTPRKSQQAVSATSSTSNLLSRLFTAALDSSEHDIAYSALTRLPDALQRASLQKFVHAMIRARKTSHLLSYPFTSLTLKLDDELLRKTRATSDAVSTADTVAYHKLHYALRIQDGNFHGAAQCLWDYITVKKAVAGDAVQDPRDDSLSQAYLMLINALDCCGTQDAWILDQEFGNTSSKRRLVFLEDVRKQYNALLKQAADLNDGNFAFANDDGMELDV